MNISDRQTKILALVETHGAMTIEMLAEEFGVSPQTIRRDVNMLCRADQL